MQGAWVLRSKAYQLIEADNPHKFMMTLIEPKGYKYLSSAKKLGQLAKAMNVDAVVAVQVTYTAAFSRVGVGGLVAAGTHSGKVTMTVLAIDRDGKKVWSDTVEAVSDKSIGSFGESANFVKLYPLLEDASQAVTRKLLERLDRKVASS